MTELKLTYFNARGRAEISRLLLVLAGVPYQDHRIEYAEWPQLKEKTPFGGVPLLEVKEGANVRVFAQSMSIARYLANKYGFAGKNDLDKAEVDMYLEQGRDLQTEFISVFFEKDAAKKAELLLRLHNEVVPKNLLIFETKLAKNGTGYLVGDSLTVADLFLFTLLEGLKDKKDAVLSKFANLKKLDDQIRNNARIAEWLKKRPETDR